MDIPFSPPLRSRLTYWHNIPQLIGELQIALIAIQQKAVSSEGVVNRVAGEAMNAGPWSNSLGS
jgi:hypothetical protein